MSAASCSGKERYQTPQMAHRVARRRNSSKGWRGMLERHLAPYRCKSCGHFHIGGQTRVKGNG